MKLRYILVLFIVYLITHWLWIANIHVLSSGDWGYYFNITQSQLLSLPYVWLPNSIGSINIEISMFAVNVIWGLISSFYNFAISERLIYMLPILLFTVISPYMLTYRLIHSKIPSIISSLVYGYNTYFLLLQTGQLTLTVSLALMPLILLLFMKVLEEKKFYYVILTSLVGFIASAYEFRVFYITVWILLFYFIYYVLFINKKFNLKNIFSLSIMAFLPMFFIGLLNIYWILGLSNTNSIASNVLFSRGLFGNQFLNIDYAITLFHPFWTGSKPAIFVIQPIPFYFWLIPLFAFLGLLLNRKNKDILFFGFVALLGILLTKQAAYPFNGLYLWLYSHIPGFNAFREASKFYGLIVLGYAVLIGSFVDWLWENWKNSKFKIFGKYFLIFLIAFIFVWNTKPLITGEIGTLFIPRHIPNDYITTKNYILKQQNYFRTLWIPTYSRWSIFANQYPELGLVNEGSSDWYNFFKIIPTNLDSNTGKVMIKFMEKGYTNNLLNSSSIKYVFVPLEDKANDDDFFVYYGEPRQYYINALNKITWLKKINIGTKEIAVYENPDFRPHIYTTQEKETITKNVPYQKISYSFDSPTQYTFVLRDIKNPLYVNFSESYNSNWRMHIGNFNWFSVLTNKNYFLPKSWHFQNDATLSSFYINPALVCNVYKVESSNGCVRNKDGSYTIYGTLYFTPQSYMYLGLIISGTTLVGILGYLGFVGFRFIKNKLSSQT